MAEGSLPKTIGKYTISGLLGRGAMGVVYKGLDPLIKRTVAIKVVRKAAFDDEELAEALNRFKQEAQAAGRLIHPNIVTIYEYGEEEDAAFIAMEYVEGKSLKDLLRAEHAFTLSEVADIIKQLITGLQFAHKNGIVHRDIKPDNLIFAPDGTLKIMDFGIARLESSSLTMAGSVMGTPSYMAPELFSGEKIDQRSDLFSAGILLYQLLTGQKPFSGSNMTTIMHQVVNIMPAMPSEVDSRLPTPLDNLMRIALAKNPDDRFQNGTEFMNALEKAFNRVDNTLVTRTRHDKNPTQDDTFYEAGSKSNPQLFLLSKLKQHSLAISLVLIAFLFALIFWFFPKDEKPGPEGDTRKKDIISNQPEQTLVPKTIVPTATKKKITPRPQKSRTGITISTPGSSEKGEQKSKDSPASRNAITITVPDRR